MQGMIQDKLICHASGDFSQLFVLGFYLYHIVQDKETQKGKSHNQHIVSLFTFDSQFNFAFFICSRGLFRSAR